MILKKEKLETEDRQPEEGSDKSHSSYHTVNYLQLFPGHKGVELKGLEARTLLIIKADGFIQKSPYCESTTREPVRLGLPVKCSSAAL